MDFKIGTYKGLSYEEYAAIPAYRSHDLMAADRCVFSWKNEAPMKETPALIEGRLQHTVFLEFDKFDEEFVIQPQVDCLFYVAWPAVQVSARLVLHCLPVCLGS